MVGVLSQPLQYGANLVVNLVAFERAGVDQTSHEVYEVVSVAVTLLDE